MKLKEALDIIENHENRKKGGYMVSFERIEGGSLASDYFPDKHSGEKLLDSIAYAWEMAYKFYESTDSDIVNIYVIDSNFSPVGDLDNLILRPYRRN